MIRARRRISSSLAALEDRCCWPELREDGSGLTDDSCEVGIGLVGGDIEEGTGVCAAMERPRAVASVSDSTHIKSR